MFASRLAAALARRNIHYGWVVIAGTFLSMLVTAGAMSMPGVLVVPLQREFGWDAADVSSALAVRLILFGAMAPFAAALMNRFGVHRVVTGALLLIAAGYTASLAMTSLWQLVLFWGVVVGFGTGMVAMVLGATVATRWFTARRGLAMGVLAASMATGQLVFLRMLAGLNEQFGWKATVLAVIVPLTAAVGIVLSLLRDRPSDVGLLPYGETKPTEASVAMATVSPFTALREAAQTRLFWVLFGSDRKSTRLNSSHSQQSRMPSSA